MKNTDLCTYTYFSYLEPRIMNFLEDLVELYVYLLIFCDVNKLVFIYL